MSKPTVIILAGGKNSRFFPLNTSTHKGFLSLAGGPIVAKALKNLKLHGFNKVVVVVSPKDYDGQGFSKFLEENDLDLDIKLVLQKEAKGMGDALLKTKEYLSDRFIVASPYYFNMGSKAEKLWLQQQKTGANCVCSGTETENIGLFGAMKFDPQNPEKVVEIVEKPKKGEEPSSFKIDSFYLFDNNFIDELANTPDGEYSLELAISNYAKKAAVTWIKNMKQAKSVKYPWHLFESFKQIMAEEKTSIADSAELAETAVIDDQNGPVVISEGAKVGDFAKIVGPSFIGKNAFVGDYSFVRGSSLEEGVVVGANTEIVRSILMERASIHFGYLADSILGVETKVGAGLITANKRLDRKDVRIEVKSELVDTKRSALGIITGNNVQIGIRVNTMPGIMIGENSVIFPNLTVSRNVKENETLKK